MAGVIPPTAGSPLPLPPLAPLGRYVVHDPIASGGMATVYFGSLAGAGGFRRTVAIKRLHPHLATDQEFVAMLLDEARLASRIRHPNVVPTFDAVSEGSELFLVMEYVHGESVSRLIRAANRDGAQIPLRVTSSIMCGALHGLHAAHEATDERGAPLGIVHRDVSPQNILVGADGVPRIVDFGVAKAAGRIHTTQDGRVKGKFAYMAPEQLRGAPVDRRTDVFAAGVLLWEMLTGRKLFVGDSDGQTVTAVLERIIEPPGKYAPDVPVAVNDVVLRAVARDPDKRFEDARQMALALEAAAGVASPTEVGAWVDAAVGDSLAQRQEMLERVERSPAGEEVSGDRKREVAPAREAASQVSSLSVTKPSEPRPRGRVWPLTAAAIAGVGLVVAVSGLRLFRAERASVAGPASGVPAAAPSQPAPSAPALSASATLAEPPSSVAIASAAASISPPARQPRGTPARGPRQLPAPATAPAAAPSPNCAIPYTVDASGVRHYKPECPLE